MFEKLPKDLLYLVSLNLNTLEYHKLRLSFCSSHLGMIQYQSFPTLQSKGNMIVDGLTRILMEYLDDDRFVFLAKEQLFTEFVRSLKWFHKISPGGQNIVFDHFWHSSDLQKVAHIARAFAHLCPVPDTYYDNAPIQLFSELGCEKLVRKLLQNPEVDPSVNNNHAIGEASANGHLEVVKLLLEDPRVDPTDQENYAIVAASAMGHWKVVQLLLSDPRVDPTDQVEGAMREATVNGHVKVVELLLDDGRSDPNNFMVYLASRQGHDKVVELLLADTRVEIGNLVINLALDSACANGYLKVVKRLLNDARIDPSQGRQRAICAASEEGHDKVVRLLLKHPKVDPGANQSDALFKASKKGHWKVVELLLKDPRVDPRASDYAAFREAMGQGHLKVVELFLKDCRVNNDQRLLKLKSQFDLDSSKQGCLYPEAVSLS